MKIFEYIQRQGAQVNLAAIQAPPTTFESPLEMFTQTLAHEQFITRSINDLMELAGRMTTVPTDFSKGVAAAMTASKTTPAP